MAKKKYYYIAALYNIIENGEKKTMSTSYFCTTDDENNPSGIPTMGFMVARSKRWAKEHNVEYVEDSFYIISIIKLTKAQFEQLNDKAEPNLDE